MRKWTSLLIVTCLATGGYAEAAGGKDQGLTAMGRIAFVANLDGNWDLFVADEDGSNLIRVTETPFDEKSPSWSPDGNQIACSASDGRLRIIDVQTKKVRNISPFEDKGSEIQPVFSPDGEKIIFVVFGGERVDDSDLAILDLESGKSEIFFRQRSAQFFPTWSPDGSQIAYLNVHCSLECGRIIQEIWAVQTHQKTAGQVLMTNSQCMQPDWSPDGERIVLTSDKEGNFDIWVYDFKSRNLKQLTKNPAADTDPCWSPQGERIAFTSTRSGAIQILIMDKGGGNLQTFRPFDERQVECRSPDWK